MIALYLQLQIYFGSDYYLKNDRGKRMEFDSHSHEVVKHQANHVCILTHHRSDQNRYKCVCPVIRTQLEQATPTEFCISLAPILTNIKLQNIKFCLPHWTLFKPFHPPKTVKNHGCIYYVVKYLQFKCARIVSSCYIFGMKPYPQTHLSQQTNPSA